MDTGKSVAQLNLKILSSFETYSVSLTYPFIISGTMCDVSFYMATLPKDHSLPEVMVAGSTLGLSSRLPNFVGRNRRILKANKTKKGFNENASQAQGFKKTGEAIDLDLKMSSIRIHRRLYFHSPLTNVLLNGKSITVWC